MKIKTQLNRLGRNSKKQKGFVNSPIYRGSTIVFDNFDKYFRDITSKNHESLYGLNSTPLSDNLEESIKKLYNCDSVVAVSSGLSSISVTFLALLKSNDHILVTDSLYSPTREFINKNLVKFNISVDYYDPELPPKNLQKLIRKNTRFIFIESPGTATFDIQDIPEIVKIAKKNNIATIADNTWASFLYCNPFKLGVDIVIEAATKYINGHADILLGLIASNKKFSKQIRSTAKGYGINSGSEELYLSIRGLRTMMLRIEESQKNALILARYLKNHKLVSKVLHPAIKTHKNHKIWKRDFRGSSGLFGIEMKKKYSKNQLKKFFNKLKIFELGYSWGGYESLITFPSLEERKINIYKGSIFRIHCGLEDIKDLKSDMENALKALNE
tara:strand:- start:431 stop:1588 length:1158 start_codon:yes stop_codon:yes gene_type:complete